MFKAKIKQSYSFKMLCCIFLVLVIILSVFVAYLFSVERKQGLKIMENYNESIIASVNSDFSILNSAAHSTYVSSNLNNVMSLMYSEASDSDKNDYYNSINKYLGLLPNYNSALIYNNKTKEFFNFAIGKQSAKDIENNITTAATSISHYKPYISKLSSSSKSNYILSYYNFDYIDGNTMNGAFVLNLSLDWIKSITQKQTQPVNIVLFDANGTVMYDVSNTLDFGEKLPNDYVLSITNKSASFTKNSSLGKSYITTATLGDTDYYFAVEQSYSGIYSSYMRELTFNFIFLILFVLFISIITSLLLSSYLAQPIQRIKSKIGNDDPMADNDLFAYISSVLEAKSQGSSQLEEMQLMLDDVRQQNVLRQLLLGNSKIDNEDSEELAATFANDTITGIMLSFADIIDVTEAHKVCNDFFSEIDDYKFISMSDTSLLVLLKNNENIVESRILLEDLRDKFTTDMNMLPSIFVSEKYSFTKLNKLYNEINIISGYELLYGRGCIIDSTIIRQNNNEQNPSYPKDLEKNLLAAIDGHNIDDCIEKFDALLSQIISFSLNDFKASLMRLAFALEGKYENGENKQHKSEVSSLVKQVSSANTMNDVYNCFTRLFEITSLTDNAKSTEVYQQSYVEEAIHLIETSYKDPLLNLESISEVVKLSTNYLGRLFKAETGLSVNNYITKFRLEKAIKFLDDSNISIKEIIIETGFINESNFYRQFKKQYGITPNAYRAK